MTQKKYSPNFDLWPEYLKFVDAENKAIRSRNDPLLAAYNKQCGIVQRHNKKYFSDFERLIQQWKENAGAFRKYFLIGYPWYTEYSDIRQLKRYPLYPEIEELKQPSIEEFLTWQHS